MRKQLFLSAISFALFQTSFAQNTTLYWSLVGNSNATATSKLGTTNNIPLRLLTNNVERLRIGADGKIGIGTTLPVGKLTVFANGSAPNSKWITYGVPVFTSFAEATGGNGDHILAMASNTINARPNVILRRSRGTLAAPTAVLANDFLSSLQASGYDGSNFQNPANIDFFVDGTPSTGNVPARISFTTGSNLSNRQERLKISSNGDINFNEGQMVINKTKANVGIGVSDSYYNWKLQVMGDSSFGTVIMAQSTFRGAAHRTAVSGIAINGKGYGVGVSGSGGFQGIDGYGEGGDYKGSVFGVSAFASGTAGTRYGVAGHASGGDNVYGIYGWALEGKTFNAAGYFNGDVWASSYNTISDRKFKSDIQPLKSALSNLMKLHATSYTFKGSEYKNMHLPKGKQLGLIADEVKEVFPELVTAAVHPAEYDKETRAVISPEIKYEGVNYQGLIPVLIASIQEQQVQIEKQQAENEQLVKRIEKLEGMLNKLVNNQNSTMLSSASLSAANPNPANGSVVISYNIPQQSNSAQMIVTDMKGSTIKRMSLRTQGNGQVQINTSALSAGTYTYTLFVNGQKADSKQFLVTR